MDTQNHEREIAQLAQVLGTAEAVVVGAGAGLSTSAGFTYAGERFERLFSDFIEKYGFTDMYSAGFYQFPTLEEQRDMRVPTELVPMCPKCGRPFAMNLRADSTFVEDEGWHAAALRYEQFLNEHAQGKVLYLELGVGGNTPGIIKYPFWRLVNANPQATYASINLDWVWAPSEIRERTILIGDDIDAALRELCAMSGGD